MPSVLFAGLLSNLKTYTPYISWVQYLSPTRFGLEALCWAQWPDDEAGVQDSLGYTLGYWDAIYCLAAWAVFYRLASLICLNRLARSAF